MIIRDYKHFHKVTTNAFGTNTFKVFESKIMIMRDYFVKIFVDCPFYYEIILQQRKYK